MFENRARGAHLAKYASYGYIIMAILTVIASMIQPSNYFFATIVFYMLMFFVTSLSTLKFSENKYLWILLIICGIVTIMWTISILGILLSILLFISAYDIIKELKQS